MLLLMLIFIIAIPASVDAAVDSGLNPMHVLPIICGRIFSEIIIRSVKGRTQPGCSSSSCRRPDALPRSNKARIVNWHRVEL